MATKTQGRTWKDRHDAACLYPRGSEGPIIAMYRALSDYVEIYKTDYPDRILGDDYVLGAAWLRAASAFQDLLDGDCGRLDCGTLDGLIRDCARNAGFSAEEVDDL